jgi:hypothetical protein
MKKIVILSVVALIAMSFVACSGDEVKKYKGTYEGTYTFQKDGKTKPGKVPVIVNPAKENSLMVYDVLNLDNVSEGVYASTSENADIMLNIIQTLGVDLGAAGEQIKKVAIKATFSGDRLDMNISYEVSVLDIATVQLRVVDFTGTKKSK